MGFDILLYSSWDELKMSDTGKWTFIHSETGVNTGLRSQNLAECVAGCPEEWLLWEAYNTTCRGPQVNPTPTPHDF